MAKARKQFSDNAARKLGIPSGEGYAFLDAARKGDLEAVKTFVEKYGPTAIDVVDRDWSPRNEPLWKTKQQTALHIACWEKHDAVAQYLLEKGANPNAQDKAGDTPLMLSHEPTMAGLLLDSGADIERGQNEGHTALMWPSTRPMLEFLISRGANVEARDKQGMTALMHVADGCYARGHATSVDNMTVLLDAGADVNARDSKGQTALMKAALHAVYGEGSHKEHLAERLQLLLSRGADPDMRDNDGNTAEMLARLPRPDLDGDVAQQAAMGDLLAKASVERAEKLHKMFTEGPQSDVGVMRPLKFRR